LIRLFSLHDHQTQHPFCLVQHWQPGKGSARSIRVHDRRHVSPVRLGRVNAFRAIYRPEAEVGSHFSSARLRSFRRTNDNGSCTCPDTHRPQASSSCSSSVRLIFTFIRRTRLTLLSRLFFFFFFFFKFASSSSVDYRALHNSTVNPLFRHSSPSSSSSSSS
jgi:hypothetical protein